MSNLKVMKNLAIATVAVVVGFGLSACNGTGSNESQSPASSSESVQQQAPVSTLSPEQYSVQIEHLIQGVTAQGNLTADQLEVATANVYCEVEQAYGENSSELQQVVKATAEGYGQTYMYRAMDKEGLTLNNESGLLPALGTFSVAMLPPSDVPSVEAYYQESRGKWVTMSFCKVAATQVPSAFHPDPN